MTVVQLMNALGRLFLYTIKSKQRQKMECVDISRSPAICSIYCVVLLTADLIFLLVNHKYTTSKGFRFYISKLF
jgi:hypothetical protein